MRAIATIENAVMLGFFVVLVAAGIWLLGTMADVRKAQDCAGPGTPQLRNDRRSGAIRTEQKTGEPRCEKQSSRWRWWL